MLEFTDSLTLPNRQPVTNPRAIAGPTILVQDPAGGLQRYYRLRVP